MRETTIFKDNNEIVEFLTKVYGISNILEISTLPMGTANIYKVQTDKETLLIKEYQSYIQLEKIIQEIEIVTYLYSKSVPVVPFRKSLNGNHFTIYKDRIIQVMKYIEGITYDNHGLDVDQLIAMFEELGRINKTLQNYPKLPVWEFDLDISNKIAKLEELRNLYLSNKVREDLLQDLDDKIKISTEIIDIAKSLDKDKFTFANSHGDYSTIQCIFNLEDKNKIEAVIDFARASYLPVAWEMIRSYSQSAKSTKDGSIDIKELAKCVNKYCDYIQLRDYDIENVALLYLIQLAPTTYGYRIEALEDKELVNFGRWRTKIVKWLYENYQDFAIQIKGYL